MLSDLNREPPRLDGAVVRGTSNPESENRPRDWKRSVLIAGLGTLSWVATYVGMLELIQANMGDLPFTHKIIIGFSVAMLMIMIIWLLDQLFRPHAFIAKAMYAFGYVFLSIISVGFGFGFYWKVLESRGEASRSAESAVGQVQSSLHAASTRLEQLQATLVQLTQVSNEKSELERVKGTSCPNSRPGDGPRRKMREEDAQRFQFSSEFVKGRIGSVNTELKALNNDMIRIVSDDPTTIDAKSGTRNEFMRTLSRKLDMTVTGFNAFRTDPQLKQIRNDLADRAERTTFPDNHGGTFVCPDIQLQTALRGVVKAIDQLPEMEKPEISAVEGSEATIEAFRRLTATLYGAMSFKLPPSADDLRELQKKAIQSVEAPTAATAKWSTDQGGLSKRDYVPLAVALFVDMCLFLVSMVQTPRSRLSGLMPKMRAAERGPVIDILSRFKDIHGDEEIRQNFEIFRHVVFDMNGDYYVAVPLDAPPRLNPAEREALRVEAQLLANLFASFEKEKIFKRTLLPTTSSVQKRLARQGSKFAGSEAFRVYKFTDGAWSDIILGAIMGAAKRAENEKRVFPSPHVRARPQVEQEADRLAIPTDPRAGLPPQDPALTQPGNTPRRPMPGGAAAAVVPSSNPRPTPYRMPRPEFVRDFAGRPMSHDHTGSSARPDVSASYESARPRTGETEQAQSTANVTPMPPRKPKTASPSAPIDPEQTARFGPYASFAAASSQAPLDDAPIIEPTPPQAPRVKRPAPRVDQEAEVTVKVAANSNTQAATARPAAVVAPIAAAELRKADEVRAEKVDVTLARETATFSIPMAEAMASGSLKAALSKAAAASTIQAQTTPPPLKPTVPAAPPAPASAPARPPAEARLELIPVAELEDIEVEELKAGELSDRDLALISRMAPPPAAE
ncbi:MAG: hypothetical protein AB7S74_08580 [Hyphomicrobium sp.]